jgi:hypothetical protein
MRLLAMGLFASKLSVDCASRLGANKLVMSVSRSTKALAVNRRATGLIQQFVTEMQYCLQYPRATG